MALFAPDVRHKANTTGVMLMLTGVQAMVFEIVNFCSRRHGPLLLLARGEKNTALQQKCQAL
jgi:hypothetical protein